MRLKSPELQPLINTKCHSMTTVQQFALWTRLRQSAHIQSSLSTIHCPLSSLCSMTAHCDHDGSLWYFSVHVWHDKRQFIYDLYCWFSLEDALVVITAKHVLPWLWNLQCQCLPINQTYTVSQKTCNHTFFHNFDKMSADFLNPFTIIFSMKFATNPTFYWPIVYVHVLSSSSKVKKWRSSVHSYSTRSSDKLHVCSVYLSSGTKCIKFKGSQLWNNLPVILPVLSLYVSFKCKLKDYLIWELRHSMLTDYFSSFRCVVVSGAYFSHFFLCCNVQCCITTSVCLSVWRWPALSSCCLFWQPAIFLLFAYLWNCNGE